jgi:hypothetical protein
MDPEYSTMVSTLPKKPHDEVPTPSIVPHPPNKTSVSTPIQYNEKHYKELLLKENTSFMDKLKTLSNTSSLQEILIIGILYIILTSESYTSILSKYLPAVIVTDNVLNTLGLLITAVLFGVLFIITRTFC